MAVLQKIRGWGIWLSLIIAFALLLFLVDPTSIAQVFGIGQQGNDPVGSIEGEVVKYADLDGEEREVSVYKDLGVDNNVLSYTAWRSLLFARLYMPIFEEAGIYFTEEQIAQALEDGGLMNFPPQLTQQLLGQAETNPNLDPLIARMKEDVAKELYANEYARLLAQTQYPNQVFVDRLAADYNNRTTVDLITVSPSFEGVEVSDEQINAFYSGHRYPKLPRNLEIEYLDFHVYPSEEDINAATENFNTLYETFVNVENVNRFLRSNSSEKSAKFYKEGELPGALNSLIFAQGQNQTEILADGYDYTAARVLSSATRSFSASVNVYGIENAEEADSLVTLLNKGVQPVDSLIANHSVYVYTNGRSVNLNETSVDLGNAAPLSVASLFDLPFGTYKVLQNGGDKYACVLTNPSAPELVKEVAILAHHITPSQITYENVRTEAMTFTEQATDLEKFAELRATLSTDIPLFETTVVDGLDSYQTAEGYVSDGRQLSHTLFDYTKGDVICKTLGTYDFLVIAVKSSRNEGPVSLDEAKEDIRAYLLNENAGKATLADVRAKVKDASDMAAVAEILGEQPQEKVLSYNSNDPRLIGAVSAYQPGEIGVINGSDGTVYVFQVKDRSLGMHTDADQLRDQYRSEASRYATNTMMFFGAQDANLIYLPDALRYLARTKDVEEYLNRFFF